ncbi:ABC transporter substrate-binding protein [Litorihabitans aurantiacus]|uniref:LacI family transcriptional regulator n=1 Tax=Litorihabitans aurantiacus TaxID=1930061 RepID=A0AA37XEX2_9MICO|nr:ABC transporter substrate-binding protein [Litorihabitans aurantiacus]GMA31967.1 LacI family transcriptional regulator [Litorihabitans aurantiacus]
MHRILRSTTALSAAALLALAACSTDGGGSGGGSADGDSLEIAIVSKGFQHQFWQAVNTGAQQAAEELGVTITFEGPDTETDVEQQIQMLQTAIDRGPDAVGFAALDSAAAEPLLLQAQDAGIPVVAFDSGVDSDVPVTTAATDNYAAAEAAAEKMSELIGGTGKITVIAHDQTSSTGTQRRDGFVDWIEENAPGIEIVDTQYGGDPADAADIATAMFESHPDLAGIYGTNEGVATGVVNAASTAGAQGVTIIGFDSGAAQVEAIRSGLQAGAITQDPIGIGYETVKAAVAAVNGEDLPPTIDTGFYWYDATNIDDEEIQAVLYE